MIDIDYDDINELESDIYSKTHRTPQQVMLDSYNNVHNRDWKSFLNSIEWDTTWLKHDTEEERMVKQAVLEEHRRQVELENHPFKQWF